MGEGGALRFARLLSRTTVVAGVLAPLLLAGCDLEPCGALDLAGDAALRSADAPILALSDGEDVSIIRTIGGTVDVEHIEVHNSGGTPVRPDQLMLTASGRRLTYRVGSDVFSVDLEGDLEDGHRPRDAFPGIDEIVGTLRGGDWIVYRTWAMNEAEGAAAPTRAGDSELWAVYVGDPDDLPEQQQARFQLGAGHDLRVVAMGQRHVIAREILDAETEALFLLRVAPDPASDHLSWNTVGKALHLTTGASFERVVLTEGPAPDPGGPAYDQVPTDDLIIASSGSREDARTLIFSVATRTLLANFEGAVVTDNLPRENVPGLSAVSPSGTHLAYLTQDGSLALRDLDSNSSCMVRPSTGFAHKLAGFGADGTLYFESRERQRRSDDASKTETIEHVYAYAPADQRMTRLTSGSDKSTLLAAPPSLDGAETWAVIGGANNSAYVVRPGEAPNAIGSSASDNMSYLPRATTTAESELLAIEVDEGDSSDRLIISRVSPEGDPEGLHVHSYATNSSVCVSTSQASGATTPWATRCSSSMAPQDFLNNNLPPTEQ